MPKGEVGRLKPDFEKMEAVREAFWVSEMGGRDAIERDVC